MAVHKKINLCAFLTVGQRKLSITFYSTLRVRSQYMKLFPRNLTSYIDLAEFMLQIITINEGILIS